MRKGQSEMIGLALIMILLAVGFLIYVRFTLTTDTVQSYEETQLGQTFVNSLAKSDTLCDGERVQVEQLIKELASGEEICNEFFFHINEILESTLNEWGYNYRLLVLLKRGELLEPLLLLNNTRIHEEAPTAVCNDRMSRAADTYPIPLHPLPGVAERRLEICRNP